MGTSSIESQMESRRLMRMIGLVGLMRVCGDSLEKMTLRAFVSWVSGFLIAK